MVKRDFWIIQKNNDELKTNSHLHCICRFDKREWRASAGPLSSRNLPVSHHLPSVPHTRSTCPSGRGLWLCKTPPTSHLTQSSFHGPTSAVRDRRFVPLFCARQRKQWHCILVSANGQYQSRNLELASLTFRYTGCSFDLKDCDKSTKVLKGSFCLMLCVYKLTDSK